MRIEQIIEDIYKIDNEIRELQHRIEKEKEMKHSLHKQWQNLCSHPPEYLKISNTYEEDEYGTSHERDKKDYTYSCAACGKVLNYEDLK